MTWSPDYVEVLTDSVGGEENVRHFHCCHGQVKSSQFGNFFKTPSLLSSRNIVVLSSSIMDVFCHSKLKSKIRQKPIEVSKQ